MYIMYVIYFFNAVIRCNSNIFGIVDYVEKWTKWEKIKDINLPFPLFSSDLLIKPFLIKYMQKLIKAR